MKKNRNLNYFKESLLNNNQNYYYYFNRLKELAISRFKYINMPDSIDIRFLECTLFEEGKALFFKDEILSYLALPFTDRGKLDVYNRPIKRRAYASNGYSNNKSITDSVIIYDNYMHKTIYNDIKLFACRLWLLDSVININVNAQKTPILIIADEKERLSMLNLFKEYDGNAPAIFGDKRLNADQLTVLKTDAPYVADRIFELKSNIWNEALTYLGISNVSIQKKERLIRDEINSSMGGTLASRNSALNSRIEAVELINKMFALNIEVKFNDFIETALEFKDSEMSLKEGDSN